MRTHGYVVSISFLVKRAMILCLKTTCMPFIFKQLLTPLKRSMPEMWRGTVHVTSNLNFRAQPFGFQECIGEPSSVNRFRRTCRK